MTFGGFPEEVRIELSLQRELNLAGPRVIQNLVVCYFFERVFRDAPETLSFPDFLQFWVRLGLRFGATA